MSLVTAGTSDREREEEKRREKMRKLKDRNRILTPCRNPG